MELRKKNNISYALTNYEIEELFSLSNEKLENKENICPECGSIDFIEDYAKGIIYCSCGQVIDVVFDNGIEKRNYDGNDADAGRCGVVHNVLLPQSSLGTTVTATGKIKKLHIWNSMPYKERSDNIMFKRIHAVCIAHKICKKIEDDSKILCKRVSSTVHMIGKNKGKPIITRGFNRSGIVAGCLFIACRRNDETRATKEVAVYFEIDERDVNKGIRSLLSILNDDTIIKEIGTSRVSHFIQRKCDELNIKLKYTREAMTIAKNIDKLSIISNHTTYSLAAASILLMAEINGLKTITKKRLSKTFCGLSDVTIGKTYNQLTKLKVILTDDAKIDEICRDICQQKNKLTITKEIKKQMDRFNIDTSKYIIEDHTNNVNNLMIDIKDSIKLLKDDTITNNESFNIMINITDKFNILNTSMNELIKENYSKHF